MLGWVIETPRATDNFPVFLVLPISLIALWAAPWSHFQHFFFVVLVYWCWGNAILILFIFFCIINCKADCRCFGYRGQVICRFYLCLLLVIFIFYIILFAWFALNKLRAWLLPLMLFLFFDYLKLILFILWTKVVFYGWSINIVLIFMIIIILLLGWR